MKKTVFTLLALFLAVTAFYQTTLVNPRTDKKLLKKFQDAKLGLYVHWMACFTPATGDSWEIGRGTSKRVADSITLAWNPGKFDAKTIVDFAVKAGCQYITVISKHHDGFAIWPTRYTNFNIKKRRLKEIYWLNWKKKHTGAACFLAFTIPSAISTIVAGTKYPTQGSQPRGPKKEKLIL